MGAFQTLHSTLQPQQGGIVFRNPNRSRSHCFRHKWCNKSALATPTPQFGRCIDHNMVHGMLMLKVGDVANSIVFQTLHNPYKIPALSLLELYIR